MKHRAIMAIALLALVSLVIMPVSAETLTGTLGQSGDTYDTAIVKYDQATSGNTLKGLLAINIEYTGSIKTIIQFENTTAGDEQIFTNATIVSNTTTFIAKIGAVEIGNGIIGYQRVFSGTPPVEQLGSYVWVTFYNYNVSGFSGNQFITLVWEGMDGMNQAGGDEVFVVAPSTEGYALFASNAAAFGAGDYILTRSDSSFADYSATKPSGLSITGNVTKTAGLSMASIYDATTNALVATEYTASTNTFNFNVPSETIIVSILSSLGTRYNSSVLFTNVTPTPTPTFPTGYSRTYFRCADTNTDGSVSGCNIQLKDVEGNVWSNATNLDDGIWYIDTLPLHTINAYGDATGYTDGSRIGVQEWNNMRYTIPMIPGYLPPPAEGYVWVYVHITDFSGTTDLSGATVSLSGSGLSTVVRTTDSSGIAMLQWPNVTTAFINAAKPGYTTGMKVIETSDFGPDFVTIALHQGTYTSTITPTPTISGVPTAGPTWAPYCNPNAGDYNAAKCNANKDTDMMNQVRDAGPILISLAIMATLFGLIKLMGKK